MKNLMMIFCLVIVLALAVAAGNLAEQPDPNENPAAVRVGTFDSRAIAMAYYRSDAHMSYIKKLKADHAAAKAAGDEKRAQELSTEGESSQHLAHKQGFGSWPVTDLLERIKDEIPGIAASAGVDVIISKWDIVHSGPDVEFQDVTLLMVAPFDPDKDTLKLITEELPKVDPVPLEDLENHDH